MTLRDRELEIAWLTRKVKADTGFVKRAEEYFEANQHRWSREVVGRFFDALERKKEQLYYEQHMLEKRAWELVMERDALQI